MDEAEKIIEQNEESVKSQMHDVCDFDQVLIENQAAAFDAINTLILYAVGNGDVDVTIDKIDLQTHLDAVGTRKRLSMVQ